MRGHFGIDDVRALLQVCPDCKGDGWTSEHDPNDPHDNGCSGSCPIQVQCETCHATGIVWKKDIEKREQNKKLIEEDDLPLPF
jgi:hypothetical protein